MAVNTDARELGPLSQPIAFRHLQSRREILEAFMREDGHETLTPILREAADLYIHTRLLRGRDAVRMDIAPSTAHPTTPDEAAA